ncbi:hypothetical protein F444_19619 [Phytophthora nicotianae P1976]|uniref:Uncharacterized protein n=1 Tax=Phytophthora nicotianae P1976 TaxID=1317066 RepID=A0A080Z762_PHYNI|nr:hypothetical protein F444_19619 [Phytophthora nicotianae P1976]
MSRREPCPRGDLNHVLHRAYDALLPHQRRDPTRLESGISSGRHRSFAWTASFSLLQPPSGTSLPMGREPTPTPAAPTAAASSATLQTGTQSSTLVPVASPDPADLSEELTVDSLRDLLAESADATVDSVRTALLPYLTLMARHQVQLSITPPLQGDVRTQRRLNDALGFDQVLAAVQPLSDTLPDLPHVVGEPTAQLKISREEAAAAKRLLVPVQLRIESLETLLNKSTAEVNGHQAEIKRLKSANVRIGSLFEKSKESMDVQTENLRLAMNYAEQKQDIIDALDKQIEKEREVFRTTIATCTYFVPTALSEGSLASLAWIPTLLLSPSKVFELPRSTSQHSALTRTRSLLFSDSNKKQTTKKIRSPLLKPWPRLLNKFKVVPPSVVVMEVTMAALMIPLRRRPQFHLVEVADHSRPGSAAATGEGSAAAASSPTPSRRGLHKPKAWKNKLKSKRQKAAPRSQASARFHSSQISRCSTPRPPARSPSVAHAKSSVSRPRSRSHSVSSHPAISKSPASSTSVPATPPKAEPSKDDQPPAVMNLTQDGSDEGMDEGSTAVPTVPEDPEVTHPASPTPQASFKYNNVASPPSFASSPPPDAPSSSKASCEPAGLTSPYRSSSEEDTPSPPQRSDRPPISKQPSVPPPRSPDSSDSDEGGSSNGSHDGNGDGGDDSRDDEPSFDFPSGELVMKTSRRRLTFLEHPLLSRVLLPAFRGLLPRELHEASSSRGFRVP